MSWIETYRGTVYRWEVDNVDHFTVAYYFTRFEDATLALLDAIGLGRDDLGGRACVVRDCRVRYLKELRVGDILHIQSGVIAVDDTSLILGHRVLESAAETLCTSVEQRVVLEDRAGSPLSLDAAQRRRADAHRVEWDGAPAVGDPAPSIQDSGMVDTARDAIKPWELDIGGQAAPAAFVHRFSASNAHLLAAFGLTPAYMREQQRGFSTFEFRLRFPGAVVAGDLVRVRSGLLHIGNSSMRIAHRMTRVRTGDEVATLEQSGVLLDLAARRPTPIPDDLRARAKTLLVGDSAGDRRRS